MGAMTLAADSRSSPMSSRTMTHDQLRLSPYNVRTNETDANNTDVLEASILSVGLMHALNVHPLRGNAGKWGVFAGGRRYRAIGKLIARKALPADYPIKVEEYPDLNEAELVIGSITENGPRCDLRDYEVCAGVLRAHKLGQSLEEIARELGQRPLKVKQLIRVGQLAPPIFTAYSAGLLSLEQAQAYASRDDQKLQAAVFAELAPLQEYEKTPDKIRAALKVGDRELGRQLRFVGVEAYRDAGGRFELDLFADGEERGAVVDEGRLAELVNAKLDSTRADLRRRTGRADLRFVARPPDQPGYTFADTVLLVSPRDGDGDAIILPEGDIVAHLVIVESGEPKTTWWWASRSAKFGSEKSEPPKLPRALGGTGVGAGIAGASSPAAAAADRAIAQEEGLSHETVEIFRSLRLAIMRGALVEAAIDVDVGTDFLIWSQLRLLLDRNVFSNQIGVAQLSGATTGPESARSFVSATSACNVWLKALMDLQSRPMLAEPDLAKAFASYCRESAPTKRLAGAMVAGFALDRSLNAEGYSSPVHDAIAGMVGLTDDAALRYYWEPTAELLDRIPTKQRLAIAEPFMERAVFATWSRLKSAALTRAVLGVVDGTAQGIRAALKDRAATWVHPLLRFGVPAPANDGDTAPISVPVELEAAE